MASENIKAMLSRHEGLTLVVKPCPTGHPSIGRGHNLDASSLLPHIQAYLDEHGQITEAMADEQLDHDGSLASRDCVTIFPEWLSFSDTHKKALIDIMFNMFMGNSRGWVNEFPNMYAAILQGDWQRAANELMYRDPTNGDMRLTKYMDDTKGRGKEIVRMIREG